MNQTPPLSVNLTQEELSIVLAQLGTRELAGLENHWQKDLNSTNLTMALDIGMRSLIARGLCQPTLEQNQVRLKPSVIALVGVCAKPEVSIHLRRKDGQNPMEQYYFHFAQKLFVAHTVPFTGIHAFVAFQSQPEFLQAFTAAVNLPSNMGREQPAVEIKTADYEAACQSAENGDVQPISASLTAAGMPSEQAGDLADALLSPDFMLSLDHYLIAPNASASLNLLGKEKQLWMVRQEAGQETAQVQIVSSETAMSKLQELVAVA